MEKVGKMGAGKIYLDAANGKVKIVSPQRRLVFPVEVIETKTSMTRSVRNSGELLKLFDRLKKKRVSFTGARTAIIQSRIQMLLRGDD